MFQKIREVLRLNARLVSYLNRGTRGARPVHFPRGYMRPLGKGRMVAASPGSSAGTDIMIYIQRKLRPDDLENGKLVPMTVERVIERGGKRGLNMQLSYDGAKALHALLGKALEDAETLQSNREIESAFFGHMLGLGSDTHPAK